ncbi:MAG: twin-arginine translocase subunit TatC [Thermoguttaceae bacterium]|jgi:sec-independent protein translocase protein TatC|nr:twin-arginine translocase subunit TatC [Thermoguttaceae bacterium]
MPRPREEDLFADTTMTFGEHLEELRSCLFRALAGFVLGFLVGLYFGGDVVAFIQRPLKKALTVYREEQDVRMFREFQADGKLPRGDINRYRALVKDDQLLASEVYVDPQEILEQAQKLRPGVSIVDDEASMHDAEDATEAAGKKPMRREDMVRLFLWRPAENEVRVTSLSAHEPFSIYLKASLVTGALLASPWIFYQIWTFVAAGLYPHEKKYVHVFLPFSLGLFFLGTALAFFFVFEPVLEFLFMFNAWLGIEQDIRISEWLGFVLILPLGFGIAFQLPLVMLFLERIGIFDVEAYLTKWRIAILVIFIISMFLTPADPYSMLLMAVPLTVLYFGGILLCRYMPKGKSPFDDWDEE